VVGREAQRPVKKLTSLIAIAWLAAILAWLPARAASAHAHLARAEPPPNAVLDGPPQRVIIWFTEPLEPQFSSIQVLDARGQRVDNDDSIVDRNDPTAMSVTLKPLSNGTYTVAWRNISAVDGHGVRSSYPFSVGEPLSAQPQAPRDESRLLGSPAEPAFRWLVLIAALAIVGGAAFHLVVMGPALSRRRSSAGLRQQLASRALVLLWLAMAALLVGSMGQLIVQAAGAHERGAFDTLGSPLASILADTAWGRFWLWRVGLLAVMAAGVAITMRATSSASDRAIHALVLPLGVGILLTLSLTSHAAATPDVTTAAVVNDYLHLLAASFWVGGLFHLAAALSLIMRGLSGEERRATLSAIVPRFSVLAALSVGVLIITGAYSAWAQVTALRALTAPYGVTLLVKVGLVALLLLLGALNLLWVRPRLRKAGGAARWLRRLVVGEVALALLVLLAVGFLTSLEPARQVASREGQGEGLTFKDTVEGAGIELAIEPGRIGVNRFTVSLRDRFGRPIANASDVRLRVSYLGADLGEEAISATHMGEGKYVLENRLITIVGQWQVDLNVQRPDAFDARTAFRFDAFYGGATGSAEIAPSQSTGRLILAAELALLGVLLLGIGIPLGGWYSRSGLAFLMPGAALSLIGIVLFVNTQFAGASQPQVQRNPFPPTAESLATGKRIYTESCQVCHGSTGKGNGPAAAGLNPPPLDLTVHVPLHPDALLFSFVSNGVPGTAMAAWKSRLSDEEIWHVINYLRTLPDLDKQPAFSRLERDPNGD
jgi:copper transport protein